MAEARDMPDMVTWFPFHGLNINHKYSLMCGLTVCVASVNIFIPTPLVI